ncbi:non-ribosomal peptide synthetase [Glaciimonas sp. PAMC28666]|uniref:non-ribosomal peptide synthetase n=1 Tax=Glaciimonas sp. PAMC28666 TaxID=2807626 RepID=UPI0019660F1F|nr:non-ribosomal peptide synthetase [Glaciimonas sp. PAMC28666]QRX81460.1 amino acid adenylation domain-containing protein [Glaciimonas sp. PAMC28666]
MSFDKFDIARRFIALPVAARSKFLQALASKGVDFSRLPIVPAPSGGSLPLSFAQQRLWFLDQMNPGNSAYHIPAMLLLDGQLDREILQSSLDALVQRHVALRTTFGVVLSESGDEIAEQIVHPPAPVYIAETDFSALESAEQIIALNRVAEEETLRPFDLALGPLLRVHLIRLSEVEHRLLLIQHHIISDGWSVEVLLRELALCYRAFCVGESPALPPLTVQYPDYALWQRHWLEAGERERQIAWWRAALGTEHPVLTLPTDRPRPAVRDLNGARHPFLLSAALSAEVRLLAQRSEATPFMVLLAAFQVLLSRLSGQADIRVGVSTAGRTRRETESMVGFFVNTQVLQATVSGGQRFEDFLAQVKVTTLGAQAHQDLPFDVLVDALKVERSLSHNPLVQVKFTQQITLPEVTPLPGLAMQLMPLPDHAARFDLSLDVMDAAQGIEATFSYATDMFDSARVVGFAAAYVHLLREIVANSACHLATLALSAPGNHADFSLHGERLESQESNILDAWAYSVTANRSARALQYERSQEIEGVSFSELDAASNRLAHYLKSRSPTHGAEMCVAVCASRSPELVLGLLAVLKAGGAYLPIDPALPPERIAFLLADAGVQCVLGDEEGAIAAMAANGIGVNVISLDADASWSTCDASPLIERPDPLAAAYLIYTSGSTGRPKGVVITHGALADYVCGMLSRLDLLPGESMAMVSTVAADLGHTVLFGALCSGRLLHLISTECAMDPDRFAAYMSAHQVGVLKIVPGHLQGLLQAATPADVLPRHALILGGEALPWGLCDTVHRLRPTCRVINHYGPTETTVGILTQEVTRTAEEWIPKLVPASINVPIGMPLPNAAGFVLDVNLSPVPLGSVGELYLGGAGLARGYHGRADLTAERFVPHPFADGERLYRSGDRVRLLSSGALEFLGRADDQVKIRGYRIELSEVAEAMRVMPAIAAAEVVAVAINADENRQQLVGYLVAVSGKMLDIVAIKAMLAQRLPDYMVPNHLIVLERMPLTANGKCDRNALPAIDRVNALASANSAGMSVLESALADIWKAVLNIDEVGLNDNFFALGGDSILSLQIIARARKSGMRLTPKQLFEHQTIGKLAAYVQPLAPVAVQKMSDTEKALMTIWTAVLGVEKVGLADNFFALGGDSILSLQIIARARKQGLKITPKQLFANQTIETLARVASPLVPVSAVMPVVPVAGRGLLTPAQRHFFTLNIENRSHWNQALRFDVREPLKPELLDQAIKAVLLLHASLRCSYGHTVENGWQANLAPDAVANEPLWLKRLANAKELDLLCDQVNKSLNIRSGNVFRAMLAEDAGGKQSLFIAIHHLAVDGVSWRILLEDVVTAYRQLASGGSVGLSAQGTSSAEWSAHLADYARSDALAAELPYWLALGDCADIGLPQDNVNGASRVSDAAQSVVTLNPDLTQKLLKTAPAAYRTQINDLLLTALGRVLCRFTGASEALVELEGHGREALFDEVDLSRTVGWFSSHFPVRLAVAGEFGAAICSVKETLRNVPNKGSGFGILKSLSGIDIRDQIKALPIPRITFNYLGQFDTGTAEEALLVPVFGKSGEERDGSGPLTNWLAIHGQVSDGQLTFTWVFSKEMFSVATIDRLAEDYRAELTALIAHCCLSTSGGVTVSDFPLAALTGKDLTRLPTSAREVQDIYAATPLQQGLLFHALFAPEEVAYVNQLSMTLTNPDVERLAVAWQAAVDKHAILRTGFWHDGVEKPQQIVRRAARLVMDRYDWRADGCASSSSSPTSSALLELCEAERRAPFDLARPPLMRLALVRLTDTQYRLIWTRHHLLLDGWSTAQLWAEVVRHYGGGAAEGIGRSDYRDYIGWLAQQNTAVSRDFWQSRLKVLDAPTRLAGAISAQRRSDAVDASEVFTSSGYGALSFNWNASDTARLQQFARDTRITLNTLVQGAWSLLLQRYTGKATVAFGVTVAGRPAELVDVDRVLGLFINTLPLVVTPPAALSVRDWLQALQNDNLAMREHEHAPLFEIQRWAGWAGQALFDTLLVFDNYPVAREWTERDSQSRLPALRFSALVNVESTSYPLTLVVTNDRQLSIEYGFDRSLFEEHVIRQLHAHFVVLLDHLTEDAQRSVGRLGMPTYPEQRQLMAWNATDTHYPEVRPVHRLFEQQALLQPDAIACLFDGATMDYRELDRRANQLAHRLIRLGVRPDDRVAVCLERSFALVVALLGVMKAGAAYVPIDPDYPAGRRSYMLEDSSPALVLTQHRWRNNEGDEGDEGDGSNGASDNQVHAVNGNAPVDTPQIALANAPLFYIDVEDLGAESPHRPEVEIHAEQLAYLIYTSGSTGRPKGAGNSHGALLNRLLWMQKTYQLDATDTVLQKTPFSFDVSVWEFFWPLMTGARLAIAAPGAHRDPAKLVAQIQRDAVTTIHFVPSMLQAFVTHIVQEKEIVCSSLRRIVASGEALSGELAARTKASCPQAALVNLYGPTEAAIDVTHYTCASDDGASVPIGRPIANTQIHILDAALNPLPPGIAGELYIGGIGLARGYHARPALTAERFVPDPFRIGARLYRSGDLARWRDDGVIEYLGRLDHQVKLRGLRIELGEIEALLQAHPVVAEAVVIAHGGEQLIGYVVHVPEASDPDASSTVLLDYLAVHLPAFMVPAQLVALSSMPLTPNGKLDRKALPDPVWQSKDDEAPISPTEQQVAAIWGEVLGVEVVGRADNFFALGGHSLMATQVVSRLKTELQISVPLRRLFEIATLAGFAEAVDQARDGALNDSKLDALDALFGEMEML